MSGYGTSDLNASESQPRPDSVAPKEWVPEQLHQPDGFLQPTGFRKRVEDPMGEVRLPGLTKGASSTASASGTFVLAAVAVGVCAAASLFLLGSFGWVLTAGCAVTGAFGSLLAYTALQREADGNLAGSLAAKMWSQRVITVCLVTMLATLLFAAAGAVFS